MKYVKKILASIKSWRWPLFRILAVQWVIGFVVISFLLILITAMKPMIQGYYEDGTFQFGETLFYPNYESFTIVYRFNEPYTDDGMAKNYSTLERDWTLK